jgi:hypothetical protein
MGIPLFLLTETAESRRSLRRFHMSEEGEPPCGDSGRSHHRAKVKIGRFPTVRGEGNTLGLVDPADYHGDPRWPTQCDHCDYRFSEDDHWQVDQDPIYQTEDGRQMSLSEAPPGALWEASWWERARVNGGTGPAWVVRLPNGLDFEPGMGATNCSRRGEDHDCWCVHGEAPKLTINNDPVPGRTTCPDGGGSIWSAKGSDKDWHGFVTDGELREVGG